MFGTFGVPSLVQIADSLHNVIREKHITYAIFDSVGYACGGAPEAAEHAMAYARAVRQLGVGSLHLAHIRQGENNDQRPFGSAFWHNSFRSTWNIKPVTDSLNGSGTDDWFFNRKNNLGAPHAAGGFEIDFSNDRTTFTRVPVAGNDELAQSLPLWQRLRSALNTGPRTLASLADDLEANIDSLERTIRRKSGLFTRVPSKDGITRIALLSVW